jgi:hypothetical protein
VVLADATVSVLTLPGGFRIGSTLEDIFTAPEFRTRLSAVYGLYVDVIPATEELRTPESARARRAPDL